MADKVVFGMLSTRVDDALLGDMMDALDAQPGCEDNWTLVSWRRSASTRFVVQAFIQARCVVYDPKLSSRIQPLGRILEDMDSERNEWLTPQPGRGRSALERARIAVGSWRNDLVTLDGVVSTPPVSVSEGQDSRPQMRVVKNHPSEEVLRIFGLDNVSPDVVGELFTMRQDGTGPS